MINTEHVTSIRVTKKHCMAKGHYRAGWWATFVTGGESSCSSLMVAMLVDIGLSG